MGKWSYHRRCLLLYLVIAGIALSGICVYAVCAERELSQRDPSQSDVLPEQLSESFALLYYMAKNKGIALTRETLITEVWGYDFYGDDRTLDTHIKLLRSALKGYRDYIVTLRGVGYRFEA